MSNEPVFLKIKGGWISPIAIQSVETHRQNEAMLIVRIVGKEHPIPLNESDSAYLADYLNSRSWPRPETHGEPQGATGNGDA